jgi:penicillin-binding protein 1A
MQEPPTTVMPPPPAPPGPAAAPRGPAGRPPAAKPRLKKLRLALILLGLAALALVSTVFGMMMAVASDLPQLESRAEYDRAENSIVYSDGGEPVELARLTGNENRILLDEGQISPTIENAVIAIEDRRFYEHEGVDYRGIARAFVQDVLQRRAAQGGSTITQQFVKNALAAQADRSVFQKLREAALAYHLERQWSKQKVLTQYLNSVYFGNGAYGIEAAVRTYFGSDSELGEIDPATGLPVEEIDPVGDSREPAAATVSPAEAALLAGMIASPSLYDPIQSPRRAAERRNLVLQRMLEQETITRADYEEAVREPLPDADDIHPPQPHSTEPYFTTWLTQQLVDRYGPGAVFGGGLEVTTTLDPELQAAAEQAIAGRLGTWGPSASLVAIENRTGEVKAMVGGHDFETTPFNLATNGHRQPGSSFKPFILLRALADGISPEQTYTSAPKELPVPGSRTERFVVNNYEDSYSGVASLRGATTSSDNSVYAEVGMQVGTRRVARLARRMGIKTEISTNPAMTLGGLTEGLTPLELAYAYSTIANKGTRVSGSLASSDNGPVAIERVEGAGRDVRNERRSERVFSDSVGELAQELLAGVVASGTGKAAQIGEFAAGKTGTTENYGDAWFVGFNNELTVAVWVGYPDELRPMETEYAGGPVAGGTYPAEIWHDLMSAWIEIRDQRRAEREAEDDDGTDVAPAAPTNPDTTTTTPEEPPAEGDEAAPDAPAAPEGAEPAPQEPAPPAPAPEPAPAPAPAPTPAPAPGGGSEGGAAAPQ